MLFNSFEFILVFLPVVFLLHWLAGRGLRWQNVLLVVASYVFYGWWDWRFLLLIALTSACSYGSGLLIGRSGERRARRFWCGANIILNLGILAVFKYCNFFVENLQALLSAVGYRLDWGTLNVVLPVGISFYTFQALSYTIDVYRGKIAPTRDVVGFFAFISFFPQLVAGPIERATNLLPQFGRARKFDYDLAVDGCRQMLWGFVKKLVVADNCAAIVNAHWSGYESLSGVNLLVLGFFFTMQIYCDFSGYSDIAIGCARLFGINLMRNFDNPYFSRSVPEFWRRWHISLMTWLRDYVYIPLGGSRRSLAVTVRNTYVVWIVSGLWHGAAWTFVCWGLYHATLLVFYRLLGLTSRHEHVAGHGRRLPSPREGVQMALTFLLALLGWVIFRAESMAQAVGIFRRMALHPLDGSLLVDARRTAWALLASVLLLAVEWTRRERQHALQFDPGTLLARSEPARLTLYAALIVLIVFTVGQVQTFIYFQF